MRVSPVPSGAIVRMLLPLRTNAIFVPSGDHTGSNALYVAGVTTSISEPSGCIVRRRVTDPFHEENTSRPFVPGNVAPAGGAPTTWGTTAKKAASTNETAIAGP